MITIFPLYFYSDSVTKEKMIMKETFGQRLSRFRKAKGLTQEDVAKQITISPQAVSKWENDISSPDILELSTLADILGVSVNELLGREENKKEVAEEVVDAAPQPQEERVKSDEEIKAEFKQAFDDAKKSHAKDHKPIDTVSIIVNSVLMTAALIGYMLLGFFWTEKNMGWNWGWVLFPTAIALGSILNAIKEKKMCNFVYPLVVLVAYCTLGFFGNYYGFNGWHPYWFLWITIPVYYVIGSQVDKAIHKDDPVDPDGDKD